MQRLIVGIATITLCLFVQTFHVSSVRAEERDGTTQAAVGLSEAFAIITSLPIKVAACGATAALGGVGYGLTLGHSEFIQQEVLGGLPSLCSARLETVPIRTDGPRPEELVK